MRPLDTHAAVELIFGSMLLAFGLIIILVIRMLLSLFPYFDLALQLLTSPNEIQRIGLLRRQDHLLIPHILQIVDHIISKTTIKQHRLLTHHSKRVSQIMNIIVFDVIPINKNLPLRRIVKS